VNDILSGRAEEILLGSALEAGVEHLAVAVATADGGALLVRIHATSARTFVRRLGVVNLLERLVGSRGVLFLSYREDPGGLLAEASWDGGPVPEPPPAGAKLRSVRDRSVFEIEAPVDAPAGGRTSLRVGLDGTPLEQAVISGMRRTLLVGLVLAGYALLMVGLAGVSRVRAVEREEAARLLADAESARRRSERLAAAGALTAGLAHDVRSPLNAIGLAAQRLERADHGDEQDCREFARRIRLEVNRLEDVLRQFLEFARPVGEERQRVELSALCAEVIELLRPEAESRGIRLELNRGTATVRADRDAVRRSIINLVRNAVQVSPDGGRVRAFIDQDVDCGRVRILDEGPGIDPEISDRLFEAFVTSRASGSGLGLALVKRVAEEHGGSCSLINGTDGGAEACLRLPLNSESPA
jgi:signal transduction histidine kinase